MKIICKRYAASQISKIQMTKELSSFETKQEIKKTLQTESNEKLYSIIKKYLIGMPQEKLGFNQDNIKHEGKYTTNTEKKIFCPSDPGYKYYQEMLKLLKEGNIEELKELYTFENMEKMYFENYSKSLNEMQKYKQIILNKYNQYNLKLEKIFFQIMDCVKDLKSKKQFFKFESKKIIYDLKNQIENDFSKVLNNKIVTKSILNFYNIFLKRIEDLHKTEMQLKELPINFKNTPKYKTLYPIFDRLKELLLEYSTIYLIYAIYYSEMLRINSYLGRKLISGNFKQTKRYMQDIDEIEKLAVLIQRL